MSDLPIRRVVLYKHGVGYFERGAAIDGDQALALSFKQAEVSDVLKSLTVLDLDGGTVSAVSYDSTKPLEHLHAEIALNIPDTNSLKALLPQLKGARVSVKPTGGAAVQGVILTSMLKRVDVAVFEAIKSFVAGDLEAGVRTFDLSNDGVGYATSGDFLTEETIAAIEELKQRIIDGDIEVPTAP